MNLSNADRDIISRAVKEFDGSLIRQTAERDLQKEICARVKDTTGVEPKMFRLLAKMYNQQNKPEKEAEFDEVLTLYEIAVGENDDS